MTGDAPTLPGYPDPVREPRWLGWVASPRSALVLVVAATAARVLWLALFTDFTLIEDEAHYWEWSRHLDWSYYSKGPGVAWAIALATALLGDTELAVRLPAALSAAAGALASASIARTFAPAGGADHRAAFVASALYLIAPGLAVTGALMTIDGPYLACWMIACACAIKASSRPRFWLVCGLAVGVGFLFKYTILLLIPGLAWVAWRRGKGLRWALAGLAVGALGLVPVLVWNAQHDWPTFRHLLGHLGAPGGDVTAPRESDSPGLLDRILWPLEYITITLFIAGPVPLIVLAGRMVKKWESAPGASDTVRMALPVAAFYLAVSLVTEVEGNWALAAPATLIPAASYAILHGVRHNIWPIRFMWGATLVTGIGTWAGFGGAPVLARLPALAFIPTQRLTGLRTHAVAVQRELDLLREQTGLEPFVITEHYGRASQLAFYLPGHPTVYTAMANTGGRRSQYDVWAHTDLSNRETQLSLTGRPAVAMGGYRHHWIPAFESVRLLGPLESEPKANRVSYAAYDYRGYLGWVPWMDREGWTGPDDPPPDEPATYGEP